MSAEQWLSEFLWAVLRCFKPLDTVQNAFVSLIHVLFLKVRGFVVRTFGSTSASSNRDAARYHFLVPSRVSDQSVSVGPSVTVQGMRVAPKCQG